MNNSRITLKSFFSLDDIKELRSSFHSSGSDEKFASLKDGVSKAASKVRWQSISDGIEENLFHLLDVNILDILARSWNKYRVIVKYKDKKKYPPDETFLVHLAEHKIKSEHKPSVEVLINDNPIGKIDFNITVVLTLQGVVLRIRDGKIKGLAIGSCIGEGTVKCENFVILERKLSQFAFPGSIDLGEGIPIGP